MGAGKPRKTRGGVNRHKNRNKNSKPRTAAAQQRRILGHIRHIISLKAATSEAVSDRLARSNIDSITESRIGLSGERVDSHIIVAS